MCAHHDAIDVVHPVLLLLLYLHIQHFATTLLADANAVLPYGYRQAAAGPFDGFILLCHSNSRNPFDKKICPHLTGKNKPPLKAVFSWVKADWAEALAAA